jgi:hypothetical protein
VALPPPPPRHRRQSNSPTPVGAEAQARPLANWPGREVGAKPQNAPKSRLCDNKARPSCI